MRRFRLSTLMLLIVIAALSFALVVQHHRAARREAELQARLAQSWPLILEKQKVEDRIQQLIKIQESYARLIERREEQARRRGNGGP
jgi:hypothetical protein